MSPLLACFGLNGDLRANLETGCFMKQVQEVFASSGENGTEQSVQLFDICAEGEKLPVSDSWLRLLLAPTLTSDTNLRAPTRR